MRGRPRTRPGEPRVDVWRIRLDPSQDVVDGLLALLSAGERARAGRMRAPEDRRRHAVARGYLRAILGAYLDRDGRELVLRPDASGRTLLEASAALSFSVSHADDLALVAISFAGAVGVDVEAISSAAIVDEVADRFLPAALVAGIRATTEPDRTRRWVELWTELEARAKLDGLGLSDLSPEFAARLMRRQAAITRVEVGDDHVACVAFAGSPVGVETLDFDPSMRPRPRGWRPDGLTGS